MPNPAEVATLIVEGHRFDDFESVMVQHRWADAFPLFRFSTADVVEAPPDWMLLQFKPGDSCTIYLGGHLAVNGIILTRQTVYAAEHHAVQLEGVGITWAAARSSILDKESKFDGMTFEQVARKVIAPTGVGVDVIGSLNPTPFDKLKNQPGETVWDFLERIARPRGIVLGSNPYGAFLLIGDHAFASVENLIEGVNVLRMNCIISIANTRSDFRVRGQTRASDQQHGTKASEQEAGVAGSLKLYSPLLTPAEQPVWSVAELADRAKNEAVWNEGTIVTATAVVQGWLRAGGALWMAGDKVTVWSPMAMLNMEMKIRTATFTQDEQGTLTTLDLVAPWLLKDKGDFNVGRPGVPQEPADAKPNSDPAQTPPDGKVPELPPATLPPH
jgi:prophage tail gpP-like protein